jgi:hypothetical protein
MGTAYDDVTGASASQTVWQPFPRQLNFPFRRSRMFPTIQRPPYSQSGLATKKTHLWIPRGSMYVSRYQSIENWV